MAHKREERLSVRFLALGFIILMLFVVAVQYSGIFSVIQKSYRTFMLGHSGDLLLSESVTSCASCLVSTNTVQLLQRENDQLRSLLSFSKRAKTRVAVANIISRDPFVSTLVTVDSGSADGVARNQAVVSGDGILVGRILAVSGESATVRLLTSPSSRVVARIQGKSGTEGTVRGVVGSGLRFGFLAEQADIAVNDLVVSANGNQLLPPDLIIGTIKKKTTDANNLFATADVGLPLQYSELSIIAILIQ